VLRIGSRKTAQIYHEAGKDHLVKHKRICEDCSTELTADRATYTTVAAKPTEVGIPIADTFPNLTKKYADRLALETQIRDSRVSLPSHIRLAMIRESIEILAPSVDQRYEARNLSDLVNIRIGSAIVVLLVMIVWIPKMRAFGLWALLFFASLTVLGMSLVQFSRWRFMQKRVVPLLSKTFQSLKPSLSELQIVLTEMQRRDRKIGFVLRPQDVI
jgi:hypothetical protein